MNHELPMITHSPHQSSRFDPTFLGSSPKSPALLLVLLTHVGCQSDSLEPTFCDDWCRAVDSTECGPGPAECVRSCEQAQHASPCTSNQQALLSCYEGAGEHPFICDNGIQRVRDGHCQTERDALYECRLPGMGGCVASCRRMQTLFDAAAMKDELGLANLAENCSFMNNACEDTCWTMLEFGDLYLPLDAGARPDAGIDLPEDRWSQLLVDQCWRELSQ